MENGLFLFGPLLEKQLLARKKARRMRQAFFMR
jgi:hypothetical protein